MIPKYEKSYTFQNDFTSFDVAQVIAQFRREFEFLEGVKVLIAVEKEYRLKGLKYDFFSLKGVEIDIGLQEPNVIIIQTQE